MGDLIVAPDPCTITPDGEPHRFGAESIATPSAHVWGCAMSDSPQSVDRSASALTEFLTSVYRRPCRIVLSWGMAGGLVAGGFLIAAATLTGRSSGSAIQSMTVLMFGLGAAAGMTHGALLAYLARDPSRSRGDVIRDLLRSLTWTALGLTISAVAALWISLTATVLEGSGSPWLPTLAVVLAWVYGIAICGWAAWEGLQGVLWAYRRWPQFRTASLATSVVFAALLTSFLAFPPEIWFTELRVNNLGAVFLAFGASVWIALPVAIGAFGLLHRRRVNATAGLAQPRPGGE